MLIVALIFLSSALWIGYWIFPLYIFSTMAPITIDASKWWSVFGVIAARIALLSLTVSLWLFLFEFFAAVHGESKSRVYRMRMRIVAIVFLVVVVLVSLAALIVQQCYTFGLLGESVIPFSRASLFSLPILSFFACVLLMIYCCWIRKFHLSSNVKHSEKSLTAIWRMIFLTAILSVVMALRVIQYMYLYYGPIEMPGWAKNSFTTLSDVVTESLLLLLIFLRFFQVRRSDITPRWSELERPLLDKSSDDNAIPLVYQI